MARSASGFSFDTSFMPEEEVKALANALAAIDPYWANAENMYDGNYTCLSLDESGIGYDDIITMVNYYIDYIKEHYPAVETTGDAYYHQLNAEGTFKWFFYIKGGKATIEFTSAPMDSPTWCGECDEWLDFDISELTPKNYKKFFIKCPKCGNIISPYRDYNIEIFVNHR